MRNNCLACEWDLAHPDMGDEHGLITWLLFERFWSQVAIAALLQYELHCENLLPHRKYDAMEYLTRILASYVL